jgi:hypothetical protein
MFNSLSTARTLDGRRRGSESEPSLEAGAWSVERTVFPRRTLVTLLAVAAVVLGLLLWIILAPDIWFLSSF